jgi:hypothetical protein
LAVIATLSKGYDLDYIWKQVDQSPVKYPAGYYIQASETGGEPPGRWWGPGAKALGIEPGEIVERKPYDLLFGERKAPDGTQLGRSPGSGRKAAGILGYEGAGTGILTPVKRPSGNQEPDTGTRTRNALLRDLRCRGERGFALLTQRWAALQHITADPDRTTEITRAALDLTQFEHKYIG